MNTFLKNTAYGFGKIFQGLVIFFKTLSWATIKSWKFVSKGFAYGNDFTTAAREIHSQVEKGRTDKSKEKNYTHKERNVTQEPDILYNRN